MSTYNIRINIRINYPVILFTVLAIHVLIMTIKGLPSAGDLAGQNSSRLRQVNTPAPIQVREIRTVGSRESKIKNSSYLVKGNPKSKTIAKKVSLVSKSAPSTPKSLSLRDLTAAKPLAPSSLPPAPQIAKTNSRPGNRPDISRPKAIEGISLSGGRAMREFANGEIPSSSGLSDPMAQSLSNSDVSVNLEVPEGVGPDELNKYELMFYGFQRRTAINYVNAFYSKLDKFQRENPHLSFPMTESKQVLTGRLTYDGKGNIKQIKMIRWTNVDRLQDFFVDVLKEMDTLQNPPQALWEQNGEFSIFFSLVVNG
jgi:hypothetical protein